MAEENTAKFEWVVKTAKIALLITLILAGAAVVAAAVMAVVTAIQAGSFSAATPYLSMIVGIVLAAAWLPVAYGIVRVVVANEQSVFDAAGHLADVETLMADQKGAINTLIELGKLSDQAKSLVYHEVEVEAFREAIHGNLIRQDYRSAEMLVDSIESKLGYADEAARLRKEVQEGRQATVEEKIDLAVRRVMAIVSRFDWPRAHRETRRLLNLFPDNPKIVSLPDRIEQGRLRRKGQLLQAYGEATRKNDVDASIQMLTQLDRYLTPPEAGALRESARGVFKAKLHNLGVQFAIRVTEQQWAEAVAVGEEIVRSYPNSRMAQEVRAKLSLLRSKAAQKSQAAQNQAGEATEGDQTGDAGPAT